MIYTFYSYKGGVGRTMALANVAEIFYQAGLKVLMIDWDLEAPGLERFFLSTSVEEILDKPGVMDMLLEYKRRMARAPFDGGSEAGASPLELSERFIVDLTRKDSRKGRLWLLSAGRRSEGYFAEYANAVLTFDWRDFYQNWEGELYFEWLRQKFAEIADVVLIDSRTGVTEIGGVCTYQLADVVVMLCAANRQNLEGVHRMAREFRRPELQDLRGGRPLEVLVIPARLEQAEGYQLNRFKEDFLNRSFAFVPSVSVLKKHPSVLWGLGIPYIPYYAYNEEVATRERDKAIAAPLVEAFEKLARTLARLAPPKSPLKRTFGSDTTYDSTILRSVGGEYLYDVFVSNSHTDNDWVRNWLVPRLKDAGLNVCTDREAFVVGMGVVENLEQVVDNSRHILIVLSPAWVNDQWPNLQTLLGHLDSRSVLPRLLPVLHRPCEVPGPIRSITYANLTDAADQETEFVKLLDGLRVDRRLFEEVERPEQGHLILSSGRSERAVLDLIPEALSAQIRRGDCVLFFGADLPLGYDGAPPAYTELARTLATRYDLPVGRPWPETAATYLAKYSHDRHGLIGFLMEELDKAKRPSSIHRAIAQLSFRAIITSWYDELLELSLREAGYRIHRVIGDLEMPYSDGGKRDVLVVHLLGCISEPESLVLTKRDQVLLTSQLTQKLETVKAFAALRPLLFVGHDPADDLPIALFARATDGVVEHMRRAYMVWPQPTEKARTNWDDTNVELIDCEPAIFLETLAAQTSRVELPDLPIRVEKPPYKFLDYFDEADYDIFCGRDTESQVVFRLTLAGRLLTLFGPSGAGKTSLLLAGVFPRLRREGYTVLYLRTLDDLLQSLKDTIVAQIGQSDLTRIPNQDLREVLRQYVEPDNQVVIVFDQFEEFLLRVSEYQRKIFFEQIAGVAKENERDIRFIFSLREDYLAQLDEARAYIPEIIANSYRLKPLDRSSARLAIIEPARRAGVTVEPALVDALVGHADAERDGAVGDLVEANGMVSPATLQIVMDASYQAALSQEHALSTPLPSNLTLTLDLYNVMGGASAMLAGYVDNVLDRIPQMGGDQKIAVEMLKTMVTSRATKYALTHDEIAEALLDLGALDTLSMADRELTETTLLSLTQARLVRGFERDGATLYELTHDYLAAEIATWIHAEEMQVKLARELLRREVESWHSLCKLIEPTALKLIHERRDDLRRLSGDELELLFRSALAAGYEVAYWFDRARQGGVTAGAIALEGLKGDHFRTRVAAVAALGALGEQFADAIITTLVDEFPQVRGAAVAALERLRPGDEWREQLKYECYIPAGEFVMGNDRGDRNETPAHLVALTAFYAGKYPVTNADYKRYMDDLGRKFEIPKGKADHPVVNISWYDARDYAAWAGMRLLTEAEWEKAASWDEERGRGGEGGRKRRYAWGDEFDRNRCNTSESGIGDTTPVGKYSPQGDSPYGCVDMAGNVWEWTSSLHRGYPYRVDDGREDMASSDERVLRGGSFSDAESLIGCTNRSKTTPDYRTSNTGFRVVISVPIYR